MHNYFSHFLIFSFNIIFLFIYFQFIGSSSLTSLSSLSISLYYTVFFPTKLYKYNFLPIKKLELASLIRSWFKLSGKINLAI